MATKQRVVRVSTEQPTSAVCVMGTEISLDISGSMPKGATRFDVNGTAGAKVSVIHDPELVNSTDAPGWPLKSGVEVTVAMDEPSSAVNDNKVRVSYYGPTGETLASAWLYLTCMAISLDADIKRKGVVQINSANKKKWTWGPNGKGAVLLVNCDRDDPSSVNMDSADSYVRSYADLQDMSVVILTTEGPAGIFENHKLLLHVSMFDAPKLRVFHDGGNASLSSYKHVLGVDKLSYTAECSDGKQQTSFFVEGLAFPDAGFEGLIYLNATLMETCSQNFLDTPVFSDTVVFRVAPWIMTPNTMKPIEVFVCSYPGVNDDFVEAVRTLAMEANCKLTVCPFDENHGDLWIQDEIEFGYVEAPHKTFPVVFDSPRDRQLKDYPLKRILGPDFGYVTRYVNKKDVSTLDSFGNLDVSPPVAVKGKEYPLGRILIGSSFPGAGNKKMSKIVRDFLYAQKVQSPVELYSDWLRVGHVDEFVTFVSAPDGKSFRLLLASPRACYNLFQEKQREGYGDVALFEGQKEKKRKTIDEILANETDRAYNKNAQVCIDWNRGILKQELGLSEGDIIDIPQLFTSAKSGLVAFFPNMVNMLVLGKRLGIPKPFGPIINGQCCLETEVRSLLEPLGLTCTFINDLYPYHMQLGEVHCGTNVVREPFSFHWWNIVP